MILCKVRIACLKAIERGKIMEIQNKWVVHEKRDDLYFTGMGDNGFPVLERLNSRVRTYKSERSAKMAINRIGAVEYCEFEAVYIEREKVPDVPADTVPEHKKRSSPKRGQSRKVKKYILQALAKKRDAKSPYKYYITFRRKSQ